MPKLSMPLYIDPNDVIERMQLQGELQGVREVVISSIIGAQLHVESCIGSRLVPRKHNDLFYCDPLAFSSMQPGGVYRLEGKSGFIRKDSPVTINFGRDWTMTDAQTAPGWSYTIEYERGYFLMDQRVFGGKHVQAVYTTGFLPNTSSPPLPTVPSPSYTATPTPYSPQVTYMPGSVVNVQTLLTGVVVQYLCLATTMGNPPPNSIYWQEIVQVPITPIAFNPTAQYVVNSAVTYPNPVTSILSTYICTSLPPIGTLPTNTEYWVLVVMGPEQLPMELYEGIMSDVPSIFDSSQTTNRAEQAVNQYKKLSDHSQMLLKDYFRLKGFSFRPIN